MSLSLAASRRRAVGSMMVMSMALLLMMAVMPSSVQAFAGPTMANSRRTTSSRLFAAAAWDNTNNNNAIPSLDDWMVLPDGRVLGTVWNHPHHPNGAVIATGRLAAGGQKKTGEPASRSHEHTNQERIATDTGSEYVLLRPKTNAQQIKEYEQMFKDKNNNM